MRKYRKFKDYHIEQLRDPRRKNIPFRRDRGL